MKIRPPYNWLVVLLGLFSLLLLCSFLFNVCAYWRIYGIGGWRDAVYELAGANATRQAMEDYQQGHLRLFTLSGENEKPRFTGKLDGPFEIWTPQFYPTLGRAHRYSTEQFIEFYNRKMRYMHSHPDMFQREAKKVQPKVE